MGRDGGSVLEGEGRRRRGDGKGEGWRAVTAGRRRDGSRGGRGHVAMRRVERAGFLQKKYGRRVRITKLEGSICEKTKERCGSISHDGSDGQRCATFLRGHVSLRGQPGALGPSPLSMVYSI